jgi:hypothetical protein
MNFESERGAKTGLRRRQWRAIVAAAVSAKARRFG